MSYSRVGLSALAEAGLSGPRARLSPAADSQEQRVAERVRMRTASDRARLLVAARLMEDR